MSKSKGVFTLIFTAILTVLFFVYGISLKQVNKETIFLTQEQTRDFDSFKEDFEIKDVVVIKKTLDNRSEEEFLVEVTTLSEICNEDCEVLTKENLDIPNGLITLEGDGFKGVLIIGDITADILEKIVGVKYWSQNTAYAGVPYTNYLLNKYSNDIKQKLFPLMFIICFLLLWFFSKSLLSTLVLYLPCLLSVGLSLSMTRLVFFESNLVTSIVPLLVFVINFSIVIHLYYTFIHSQDMSQAFKLKKEPLYLMIFTTFVGFLSLGLSELTAIRQFGLLSSFLIAFTALLTIFYSLNVGSLLKIGVSKGTDYFSSYFLCFLSLKLIFGSAVVLIALGTYQGSKIPILTDATEYFPKDLRIKEKMIEIARTVIGTPVLEIIIDNDSGESLTINDLKRLDNIELELEESLQSESFKILSANKIVKMINRVYSKEDRLPDHLIAYHTLKSKAPVDLASGLITDNHYHLSILGAPLDFHEYEIFLKHISKVLESSKFKFKYNGLFYHLMTAQKEMMVTLVKSFLSSLLVISVLALFYFRRLKIFFIFLFVNTLPVFISLIIFRYFDFSLNIATVMTYSISLGLVVDSTFHLVHILKEDELNPIYYFQTTVKPIFVTGLILSFTFFLFGFHDFLPIRQFGLCLGIICLIGLYLDLKVLPRLLGHKSL